MSLKINFMGNFVVLGAIILSLGSMSCMQRQQIQRPAIVFQKQKEVKDNKDTKDEKNNSNVIVPKDTKSDQQTINNNKPTTDTVQNTKTNASAQSTNAEQNTAKEKTKEHKRICPLCMCLSINCWDDQERLKIGRILPCGCNECRKDPSWQDRFDKSYYKYPYS